jgi:predicted amidohydrolase YtcJ
MPLLGNQWVLTLTLGAGQKVSVLSALRAQTIDAAWQVFKDTERGSIEVGKLADFALLSRNPLENPQCLNETYVTTTIRRGVEVFHRPFYTEEVT